MLFKSKNPKFEYLKKRWSEKHKNITQNLFDKHLRRVALTGLGGLMLLPASGMALSHQTLANNEVGIEATKNTNVLLAAQLKDKVPNEVRPLNPVEEKQVAQVLTKEIGVPVSAELQGIRLNTDYGVIGGEQHLYRYPGDTPYAHAETARDWAMYGPSGVAPGLGAWGYFAQSQAQLTQTDVERERWYIAVQTFLAPGFSENTAKYRDFFKYRKMVVVNPNTGQTVITDIADAGPGDQTGKQLGGSPEVMDALGLGGGPRKGPVLYFFVDDPQNKLPLGPVHLPDLQQS